MLACRILLYSSEIRDKLVLRYRSHFHATMRALLQGTSVENHLENLILDM